MPTLTNNFSYNKPLVNNATDADLWGGYLNANWDSVDADLPMTTSLKSSNFNVGATEFNYTYLINSSGGAVTATLPSTIPFNGFVVRFKAVDVTNTITVSGNGNTIDGAASFTINSEDEVVGIVSDGTNWQFLNFPIATTSEAQTGTADNRLMTPEKTKEAIDSQLAARLPRAYCRFDGSGGNGTKTLLSSYNVTSAERTGTGAYTITFTNNLPSTAYLVFFDGRRITETEVSVMLPGTRLIGSYTFTTTDTAAVAVDSDEINIIFWDD